MYLSVIIPAYNEATYLDRVVDRVLEQKLAGVCALEIIIVNDCSSDETGQKLRELSRRNVDGIKILHHCKNLGKGAAVRTGFRYASGDIVLIQDADLEYDPRDYQRLIAPILDGHADVVYGSRFSGPQERRVPLFWHTVGNKLLTLSSNLFTNIALTDMETGCKAFRRDVLERLVLKENRFGFEPEVTAKAARLKCRIYEVGISYRWRSQSEGKKVRWKDGLFALWCIIKYNLLVRGGTTSATDLPTATASRCRPVDKPPISRNPQCIVEEQLALRARNGPRGFPTPNEVRTNPSSGPMANKTGFLEP
jgi:glycosyltransferase involved in cell wall biosynthesis